MHQIKIINFQRLNKRKLHFTLYQGCCASNIKNIFIFIVFYKKMKYIFLERNWYYILPKNSHHFSQVYVLLKNDSGFLRANLVDSRVYHAYARETLHWSFSKISRRKIKFKIYFCRKFFALSEYNISFILFQNAFEKFKCKVSCAFAWITRLFPVRNNYCILSITCNFYEIKY